MININASRIAVAISVALAGPAVVLLGGCDDANTPDGVSTTGATGVSPTPAIWANGTGQACAINTPAVSLSAELVATLPPIPPLDQARYVFSDELWASFAQHIPGDWAGVLKANGKLVLNFADPGNLTASLDSVAIYGASFSINLPASRDLLEIRHTRWSWIQLLRWYQYLNRTIQAKRDWTGSDIDEVTNRIRYSGATKAARDDILATLAGMHVPCWLAAVDIQGFAVLKAATEARNDPAIVSDGAIVNDSANILGVIPGTSAFTVPVSPVAVSGGYSFGSITAGSHHACGITTSGETRCWGADPNGEMGVGFLTWFIPRPTLVAGGLSFVTVNAGGAHTCALTAAGGAYCWGNNLRGELGTGSIGGVSAVPVAVATTLNFSVIAAGGNHTCALTAAGAAYCWGDKVPTPTPVPGGLSFTKITLGEIHTCGIASDGLSYCWGSNGYGQGGLGGLNGGINYADPPHTATPLPVVGSYPFAALSAGEIHTCGITTDGAAYCWGDNTYGQVGKGTLGYAILTPAAVVGGLTLSALEVGSHHSCAIATTGDTYCWGNNDAEQLGDSVAGGRSPMPLKVAGGVQFLTLAGGGDHTCGLTATGAVYCWGSPALGALGNGTLP